MPEKSIKLKKINNESLVGTGNISVLTSHQDISGKLDKAQTSYKGKNVVVDSASGNITFEDKPTIPTDVSDLTDSSNTAFTPKSHTHGNLQNDGSIGTSNNASKNVVTDSNGKITIEAKPTIPSASSSTPSADTSNGSVGTGTSYARADHKHPKSSIYAEASHNHTKSQITDFPSLATVATSGSYNDLTNKPTIPEGATVDTELSTSSNNAIANSTVTTALNGKSDSGHTHSNYLTSSDISGKIDTAGTGLSKSGTTLNHSNSVTALTTASLKKVKYDAQGHITGTSDVSGSDLPSHTHSQYLTSHQDISGKEDTSNKSSSITTDTGSTVKYPTVKAVEDYAQPIGNYLTSHQDITGKEDKSNKVTSISSSSTDTQYPSAKLLYDNIIKSLSLTDDGKLYLITQNVATVGISPTASQSFATSNSYVDITITVRDSDNNAIEGIMVELQVHIYAMNTYVTIKTGYTNSNGTSTIRVGYDDVEYGNTIIYAYCGGVRSTQSIPIMKILDDYDTPL